LKRYIYISFFILHIFSCQFGFGQEYKLNIDYSSDAPEQILNSYQNYIGDSTQIQSRLQLLIGELQNEGFLAASIDSINFDSLTVEAKLFTGRKYYWNNLDLSRLDPDLKETLNVKRGKADLINLNEWQSLINNILSYYENSGYPFVKVNPKTFEIQDSLFNTLLIVEKGDFFSIDSIIVKGDAKISLNYLKRTLQIERGIAFNQEKINSISKKINDLRFLSEIKPAEIEFRDETVDLYLYLKNKRANMFNGIIGFLPDPDNNRENETGKLLITGELNLNLVNPFGKGEEIFLNWEKQESSTQKLDLGFMYPYLFKSKFGLDADFGLYKKDSTYLSLNAGTGLRLFLDYDEYIKAYYRYKSSSKIGDDNTTLATNNFADVTSNIFGASYYLNDLDYRYNPRKGIVVNVFGGTGIKKSTISDQLTDSFNTDNKTLEVEAGLDFDLYFAIYKNFVFHFGNVTRYLEHFSDSNKEAVFYENELYRFGGAKSLRGFDESIFFASIYSLQKVEIKYLFEQNSSFYAFWNGAYYYKNVVQTVTEDFPWGFGVGLDFDTRAGIFSLSYAVGKQFDNPFEIQSAKIHFGYISRF
jgi:outer membrane protein insertion porin family